MKRHKLAELITDLQNIRDNNFDQEMDHKHADQLLIDYIGDEDVTKIYASIEKWYG